MRERHRIIYHEVQSNLTDSAMIYLDQYLCITKVNTAAEGIFGCNMRILLGQDIRMIFQLNRCSFPYTPEQLRNSKDESKHFQSEFKVHNKPGKWIHWKCQRIQIENHAYILSESDPGSTMNNTNENASHIYKFSDTLVHTIASSADLIHD